MARFISILGWRFLIKISSKEKYDSITLCDISRLADKEGSFSRAFIREGLDLLKKGNPKGFRRLDAAVLFIARADIPDEFYLYYNEGFVLVHLDFRSQSMPVLREEFLLTLQRVALFCYIKNRGIDVVLHAERVGRIVYGYKGRARGCPKSRDGHEKC